MITPQDRIEVIQDSVRCFKHSLGSLLPVIGAPFLFFAFRCFGRAWSRAGDGWNPAQHYLWAGFVLCWLGAVSQTIGLGFLVRLLSLAIKG